MEQIRSFPPTDLIDQAEEEEAIRLAPAVELKKWVLKNFLTIGGQLHNPHHDHISELLHDDETFLVFAWASSVCMAKKRMVLRQCEKVMFNQGGWKKARQEQQMRDWFGCVPVYLITMDASFREQASDHDFCALGGQKFITGPSDEQVAKTAVKEGYTPKPMIPVKGDVPTIGHGTMVYPNGIKVKMNDPAIDRKQTFKYLKLHLDKDAKRFNKTVLSIPISQRKYDIYLDFTYQYGTSDWSGSSMLRHLKAREYIVCCCS